MALAIRLSSSEFGYLQEAHPQQGIGINPSLQTIYILAIRVKVEADVEMTHQFSIHLAHGRFVLL